MQAVFLGVRFQLLLKYIWKRLDFMTAMLYRSSKIIVGKIIKQNLSFKC